MIDIIIPAYNALHTLNDVLYSISYQSIADKVNVYVVDDASTDNYDSLIKKFKKLINIKLLRLNTNHGPGYAREYGVKHSKAEYIIFIDSDDSFYDSNSVECLYNRIVETNSDVVVTNFSEETNSEYLIHDLNYTWFHGKIYRRSFIENNDIHINDSRKNEDEGFNQLCYLISNNIYYEPVVTYFWRNNRSSTTRTNSSYNESAMYDYAYNIKYAAEEGLKRNCDKNKLYSLTYRALLFIYFLYLEYINTFDFKKFNDSLIFLKKIYKENNLSKDELKELFLCQYNACVNEVKMANIVNPKISFEEFIDMIGKE